MTDYIKKFFFILGNDKKKLPLIFFIFLINSFLDMIGVSLLSAYIVLIGSPELILNNTTYIKVMSNFHFSKIPQSNDLYFIIGISLIILFAIKSLSTFFIQKYIIYFAFKNQSKLMGRLMKAHQRMPYELYLNRSSSQVIELIHLQTAYFTSQSLLASLNFFSNSILFILILSLLIVTNFYATASVGILLASCFLLFDRFFKNKIKSNSVHSSHAYQGIVKTIKESIKGLVVIRVLGREQHFVDKLQNHANEYAKSYSQYQALSIIPRYILEFVLVTFIVLMTLIYLSTGENISKLMPTIGLFAASAMRLMPAFAQMMQSFNSLRFSKRTIDILSKELEDSISLEHLIEDNHSNHEIKFFKSIKISNLDFQYAQATKPSINNINLSIHRGQTIGLIGHSGSGKTTLVNLLIGLLTSKSGQIILNDKQIQSEKDLKMWLNLIAYIPQDVFILEDKLKNNIALGIPENEIDYKKLKSSIEMAKLTQVVANLPNGHDTILGEDGNRLSGGQKQRVALARAFYFDRHIIIMDEATAALDNETEQHIVDEINELKSERTIIIIAHRLSTLKNCDVIYKLHDGQILQSGKYAEVIQSAI